ncbi:hypothetical protein M2305_002259 [Gluconobacter cerinus]|uniref:Ivy family c-type lysozyme inhibitor n=1 Tax=Gluconobacter cerinus TaxID=38307 RepID=UPI001B8D8E7D|nr:Ivy family c-type lysozyme inhibitor [Gluconobacter cerinus]MBS1037067.1 hypothetical protein [Gluconobacter cerinus]MCW2266312.1 hypothetical protein [Gluconobacter cerinus]
MKLKLFAAMLPLIALSTSLASAEVPTTQELLSRSGFKEAYKSMITLPAWVVSGQGTSTPVEYFSQDGKRYALGHMCKPHDCAAQQLEIVMADDHSGAWGLLSIKANSALKQTLLGSPEPAVEKVLRDAYSKNNSAN